MGVAIYPASSQSHPALYKQSGYQFGLQDHGQGTSSVPGGCTETPSSLGLQPQDPRGDGSVRMLSVSWPLVRHLSPQLSSIWPPPSKALGDGGEQVARTSQRPGPSASSAAASHVSGALQPGGSESGDTVRSLSGSPTSTVTTTEPTER